MPGWANLLHHFVALCGEKAWRGVNRHCLASGGLHHTHPISSHFSHFLYGTGALPAVALVLNPRVGTSVYVPSSCVPFKQSLLKIQQFLLPPQPPLVFTARSYWVLSSRHWNPWLCSLAWTRITHSQGIPPDFHPPYVIVGSSLLLSLLPLCTTPCLCASLLLPTSYPSG